MDYDELLEARSYLEEALCIVSYEYYLFEIALRQWHKSGDKTLLDKIAYTPNPRVLQAVRDEFVKKYAQVPQHAEANARYQEILAYLQSL